MIDESRCSGARTRVAFRTRNFGRPLLAFLGNNSESEELCPSFAAAQRKRSPLLREHTSSNHINNMSTKSADAKKTKAAKKAAALQKCSALSGVLGLSATVTPYTKKGVINPQTMSFALSLVHGNLSRHRRIRVRGQRPPARRAPVHPVPAPRVPSPPCRWACVFLHHVVRAWRREQQPARPGLLRAHRRDGHRRGDHKGREGVDQGAVGSTHVAAGWHVPEVATVLVPFCHGGPARRGMPQPPPPPPAPPPPSLLLGIQDDESIFANGAAAHIAIPCRCCLV